LILVVDPQAFDPEASDPEVVDPKVVDPRRQRAILAAVAPLTRF
jgi:hypothetical protein